MHSLMWHLAAAGLVLNTSKTPALRAEEAQRFSLFGNTELHKRLGSMWTTICNKHPRFSRHTFECYNARIAPSNTGQTTLFPGNCLFNSLFRCRAPTIIQKIRRSTSQICSTHRGTSTRHELVGAMAWYFAWDLPMDHWSCAGGRTFWWSKSYMILYWNFASDIANLSAERSVRRALAWNSLPPYPCLGRPQEVWDITLEMFCRFTAFDSC